jgi:hypothetical protein
MAKVEENSTRRGAAEREGTTSETWPPPQSEEGNFPSSLCKFDKLLQCLLRVL